MHAFPPWFSVSVCIIQLSCYQTLFDVGCKGYFSVRVRILSMSSDSLKSFLGRARCSISLLQTTLTLLSLAILNKRSTVYKISCTKCTYSQNVFNTLKAVKINVLYYIVKKNRFIHLLFLKGQSKSKRESQPQPVFTVILYLYVLCVTNIHLPLIGWLDLGLQEALQQSSDSL